jgi:altronate dehydratase large subunit
MEFMGFRRPDGRAGIRNHVLILSAVTCANTVVDKIARKLDGVVPIVHAKGCGQGGEDLIQTRRVLLETASHPNVGATLIVGLGCETMDTRVLASDVTGSGKPVECLLIQDEGGTTATVEKGLGIARDFLTQVARAERQPIDVSELIVGTQCGASDGLSGITANPAVGVAADRLVAAGATAMLSEVSEFIGAEHILARRTRDEATAQQLLEFIGRRARDAAAAGVDLTGSQISTGNFEGGLTTPEEKSLGTIYKGGTARLEEVIGYAHRPTRRGLVVMDTPGDDIESMVGMVAGGAQAVIFTTGRGSPTGNPIAPVIKVATNSTMYQRMTENMDLNAGTILEGQETIEQVGKRIFENLRAVADGERTKAEVLGHHEFVINSVGPKL